jgi:hypothetical protein
MKTRIVLIALILAVVSSKAFAQLASPQSPAVGPTPEQVEPVDASYVPRVESKAQSLEVVSVVREEVFVHIKLRNSSDKRICSLRYSYHKNGQSVMLNFVLGEKQAFIAPGEVYVYEYAFLPQSIFARQPVIFEAVLFENGSGDGEPDKVKSLQDVFFRNRKELEHVIAILAKAIESPQIEVVTNLFDVLNKLSETPDYMYGADLQGIAGVTLPSWKATSMHIVDDIKQAKFQGSTDSIRESLAKIKQDFEKTLARYPHSE